MHSYLQALTRCSMFLAGLLLATPVVVTAQPTAFTYQGQLKEAGSPVTGDVALDCSLWDADSGGNQVGTTISLPTVAVANGLFTVELDFGGVFSGAPLWLEISVNTVALTPRQFISSAPYSQTAAYAQACNVANYANAPWVPSGTDLYYVDGKVGIGTSTPSTALEVRAPTLPILAIATSTSGGAYGVYAESLSPDGIGVYGQNVSTNGVGYGLFGISASTDGRGVLGYASAATGQAYGVRGYSQSVNGFGVQGAAGASTGDSKGVTGLNFSSGGIGVLGSAEAPSGVTFGVYGQVTSSTGYGVFGRCDAGTGNAGVWGVSYANNGNGIIAEATNGSSAYALWAKAPQGVGVRCDGALTVSGTKSFRIDHPLDPENKYLLHYCSESPEPLNTYTGNVTTDASGYANISLPNYFEEINRDFRYQLTVVDGSDDFVLAKVVRGIRQNSFQIRTSKPNVQVCWMVNATRNDRYVRRHGAAAEVAKPAQERGLYQDPSLYDLPPERGQGYRSPTESTSKRDAGSARASAALDSHSINDTSSTETKP